LYSLAWKIKIIENKVNEFRYFLWNFRAYIGYENTEGNYAEILQDNDNPVTVVCSENWSLEREQLRRIEV
jgi:hypothetical protein